MGIFSKAVDSRTGSVLRSHYGRDVAFELVAGGKGSADGLPVNLRPFMCVLFGDGLIFIHEGRVALQILWNQIREVSDFGKMMMLDAFLPLNNSFRSHFEFPYNTIFSLNLTFNHEEHSELILKRYKEYLTKQGATEEGLSLAKTWDKMWVKRPVSEEEYMKANANWDVSDEIKKESRVAWGEVIEAEKFLYYVAGGICRGYLPPNLIDDALEIFVASHKVNSKYTKQPVVISEDNKKLTESLKELKYVNPVEVQGWVVVQVDYGVDEPTPMINSGRHWAVLSILKSGGLPLVRIWDHYNQGAQLPYLIDKQTSSEVVGHLIGDVRTFTASGKNAKKFS